MKTWSVWFRADCVQVAMYKWRRWSPTVRTPTRPVKRVNFTCCGNFIVNNFSKVILPVTAYGIDQARLPNVRMNLQFVNIAYPLATLSLHSDTLLCLTTERRLVMKLIERAVRCNLWSTLQGKAHNQVGTRVPNSLLRKNSLSRLANTFDGCVFACGASMKNWTLRKILRSPKEILNGGGPHRVQKINCTSCDKRKSDCLEIDLWFQPPRHQAGQHGKC